MKPRSYLDDVIAHSGEPLPRPQFPWECLSDAVEFADNPEPRCPCVLLLDTSGSMQGAPIAALNAGLQAFQRDLRTDLLASRRVEIALVTFDSEVKVRSDFVTADSFVPPVLTAQGSTLMGAAINRALDLVDGRKAKYRANDIPYYRPWVFLLTDGEPCGEAEELMQNATRRCQQAQAENKLAFFAVGVNDASLERLRPLSARPPIKLHGLQFAEMFVWLSRSTQALSHSQLGEQIVLPPLHWGVA